MTLFLYHTTQYVAVLKAVGIFNETQILVLHQRLSLSESNVQGKLIKNFRDL